ncbi:hypothetical protein DIPPA_12717 [Diplonema papillatum]|nr:hypothetical protein DIPPA_12717 [Diplonema papillatum]
MLEKAGAHEIQDSWNPDNNCGYRVLLKIGNEEKEVDDKIQGLRQRVAEKLKDRRDQFVEASNLTSSDVADAQRHAADGESCMTYLSFVAACAVLNVNVLVVCRRTMHWFCYTKSPPSILDTHFVSLRDDHYRNISILPVNKPKFLAAFNQKVQRVVGLSHESSGRGVTW